MKNIVVSLPLAAKLSLAFGAVAGTVALAQDPAPPSAPAPAAVPAPPPRSQAYIRVRPGVRVIQGRTMVPVAFLRNHLGTAVDTLTKNRHWRLRYYGHTVEVHAGQRSAVFNGKTVELPIEPNIINGNLYVPWQPLSELFGLKWSVTQAQFASDGSNVMLVQFPGAYIETIRHSTQGEKTRVVLELSNPTPVTARQTNNGVLVDLAAARRPGIPSTLRVNDVVVPRVTTTSGNWKANTRIAMNYAAPTSWFTLDHPPRIVVDVQRIFERSNVQTVGNGLTHTRILRGTNRGPVRLHLATVDPRHGWRMKVAPAGYSVLQRNRISRIASRSKATLAVNGGFFAYDGAAVGAVKVNNEWIRLPWKGRTAVAFKPNGEAKIGNMQAQAKARFSSGLVLPVRDLNGWPDKNRITALTRRFRSFYKLRSGEMAVVVENGVVTSTPGSGGVNVPAKGFVLVGNGAGRTELEKARKGLRASLLITASGWDGYTSALGGGPRLVKNGTVAVANEGFRSDVTKGLGPRTAIGIDKAGRYLIVVADGRQGNYSTGLTLTELAYTMQKFGAVDAMNLDGGGSTAIAVGGKVVNRPSDGRERSVSNALLVTR